MPSTILAALTSSKCRWLLFSPDARPVHDNEQLLQFRDFSNAVTSFRGNGGLSPRISIERLPHRVSFIAKSDPEVFIAVSARADGKVRVETRCPERASTEPSAHIIGNQPDYRVASIKEIWELVRSFFALPLTAKFSWGDRVRIHDDAPHEMHPGEYGYVVGISGEHEVPPGRARYTIEYEGHHPDKDVFERFLEPEHASEA